MLTELRTHYERYKAEKFGNRLLRFTCTTYATFFFWNLILRPNAISGLSEVASEEPVLLVGTLLLGVIAGPLMLIVLSNSIHWLLLPIAALGFFKTSARDPVVGLIMIPLVCAAVLVMVNGITKAANFINRL